MDATGSGATGDDRALPSTPPDDGGAALPADGPVSPSPAELARVAPADVAAVLTGLDLDDADDATLVEVVAAWQRVLSWASVQSARAAAALAERESMNPTWPEVVGDVAQPCIAGDEIALRLGWSRPAANRLVAEGRAFERELAWTGDALEDGAICPAKARVLVKGLAEQPLEVALAVQESVLEVAPGLTPSQLGRRVAEEVLRIDPEAARSRHERAREGRRLDRPRLLPDGMAGVWAVVDAADAVRMDNGIDAIARTARDAGDPRTLDQLRADLLVDLVLGRVCPGPVAAEQAGDGVLGTARTAGGAGDRDGTSGGAGASAGGGARVTTHGGASVPTPGTAVTTSREGADVAGARVPSGGGVATLEACAPPVPQGRLPQRAVIRVTVPLSTLLGTSDEPGQLAGYGPVHADTARALALGGPWQRIVTDPLSGSVLDVGRTRYRPPAALADHVVARARTCVNPACSVDADACDLDHRVPFADGGVTADHNLDPACRRDHLLKTHAGHHVELIGPDALAWRTPTGHVYEIARDRSGQGADTPRRHRPPGAARPTTPGASPERPGFDGDGPPPPF